MNLIVTNNTKINFSKTNQKFNKWIKLFFINKLELEYKNISHKIIAEEYIENYNNDILDYKLWCDNGEYEYIMV